MNIQKNHGKLTEDEKRIDAELDELINVINVHEEKLNKILCEFETKKSLFWAMIENRLKVYDKCFQINEEGEILERTDEECEKCEECNEEDD